MANRYFRVDEANRLLSTVAAAMARLQAVDAEARRRHEEAQALTAIGLRTDGRPIMAADVRQAQEACDTLLAQGRTILESIRDLGVEVRSIEYGLVDFPARIAGEDVWLCWRLGEARVAFYHSVDEGFTRRRPVAFAGQPADGGEQREGESPRSEAPGRP